MNILFVTSEFPSRERPSYCIYLEQQAKALQALGNHAEILLVNKGTEDRQYTYHGLQIRELGLGGARIEKLWATGATRRRLKEVDWKRFDVVSFHFGRLSWMHAIADICAGDGVPVIQHFHGLNVWEEYASAPRSLRSRAYGRFRMAQNKRLLDKCSAVVGVSDMVCAEIRKKISGGKVFTVYNGVDLDLFSPGEARSDSGIFRVLCVANLIPTKGQRYLLEAAAALNRGSGLQVVLVGDGPDRKMLEELCARLGIAQQVIFKGVQDYETVSQLMGESHMFVMPSYYEAFGCVFVEAMGSGLLTCGCEDSGAAEIITDGEDGLLLKQKDVQSVADAIAFAMDHRQQAREIAARGSARAAAFTWERSARMLQDVYMAVTAKTDER